MIHRSLPSIALATLAVFNMPLAQAAIDKQQEKVAPLASQISSKSSEPVQPMDAVARIDVKLDKKQAELDQLNERFKDQQNTLASENKQIQRLKRQVADLSFKKNDAKAKLDRQYSMLLDNPTLSIAETQSQYQSVWKSYEETKQALNEVKSDQAQTERSLAAFRRQQARLQKDYARIEEDKNWARAQRASRELALSSSIEVTNSISCSESMTIKECKQQSKTLVMKKSLRSFKDKLIADLTEADIARTNADRVAINIKMINHHIMDEHFSGENVFTTVMESELKAQPDVRVACRILSLSDRYCGQSSASLDQKDLKLITVSIRSNLHDDTVTISGVDYGSTPVEAMISPGKHQVTISKTGYASYNKEYNFNKNQNIWVKLKRQSQRDKTGRIIKDRLSLGKDGPDMILIAADRYRIGEKASKNVVLQKSYAVSATPVTVGDFRYFISDTGYKTSAESAKMCHSISDGEVIPLTNRNWRNTNFRQTDRHPVVCVSLADATAYTKWLSKQTGHKYTLPTEAQWEIAARAGTNTPYWWGTEFGVGKANTGWSGSAWSDKSTSPVKSFPANGYGLYDTVGNVWEWTLSSDGIARGGAWNFTPKKAVVANKLNVHPNEAANYLGFRVVRIM